MVTIELERKGWIKTTSVTIDILNTKENYLSDQFVSMPVIPKAGYLWPSPGRAFSDANSKLTFPKIWFNTVVMGLKELVILLSSKVDINNQPDVRTAGLSSPFQPHSSLAI